MSIPRILSILMIFISGSAGAMNLGDTSLVSLTKSTLVSDNELSNSLSIVANTMPIESSNKFGIDMGALKKAIVYGTLTSVAVTPFIIRAAGFALTDVPWYIYPVVLGIGHGPMTIGFFFGYMQDAIDEQIDEQDDDSQNYVSDEEDEEERFC